MNEVALLFLRLVRTENVWTLPMKEVKTATKKKTTVKKVASKKETIKKTSTKKVAVKKK